MSFGRRLRLFFVGIVAIPMAAVAVLVLQVGHDSQVGKADARLAAGLGTARAVYDMALRSASAAAERIGGRAGPELDPPDRIALQALADDRVATAGVAAVAIADPEGRVLASAGPADAVATVDSEVRSSHGTVLGTVSVSQLNPGDLLERIQVLTSSDVALATARGVTHSTTDTGDGELPGAAESDATDIELPSGSARAAALALDEGRGTRLVLFSSVDSGLVTSEVFVAIALAVFLLLAFALIAVLMRGLQRRISILLAAARRIGDGDFESRVPVEGNDETAGLARELNRMSARLNAQMDELRRQRAELDESVKRTGEAFASGLDRDAMLDLVVETAVSACDAQAGRVSLSDGRKAVVAGGAVAGLEAVLDAAGTEARDARAGGSASAGDAHAMAQAMVDRRDGDEVLCTMAVARRGQPFSSDERAVLRYLVGQTIISIENVGLHERVSEQALTDGLTGIPNHRHFHEWLDREVARLERFGGELSLVLLDIDDFKDVNDAYGHLQGDGVLKWVAQILQGASRGVDLPARYGGEEFVLGLPETPREGAMKVAERIRATIEDGRVDGVGGNDPVRVTASIGVATIPADGASARELVAAADRALYRAKRAGKNRVVAAADDG